MKSFGAVAGMVVAIRGDMVASVASSISIPRTNSTLSVASRAGHAFTPQAMLQGFLCHARGVELCASGPACVHARVGSKRVYDVHLRAENGRLVIACTCCSHSSGIEVCKHAWASLLEVDRQDALGDLRNARGALVVEPVPSTGERSVRPHANLISKTEPALGVHEAKGRNEMNAGRPRPSVENQSKDKTPIRSARTDAAMVPKPIVKSGHATKTVRSAKTRKKAERSEPRQREQ